MAHVNVPQYEDLALHELADGVWAAIAQPTGLAMSNSGIVDLGDRTLVFDTTISPRSASDLRAAAEYLTGRPVAGVLNSHWHRDHVFGNAVPRRERLRLQRGEREAPGVLLGRQARRSDR